MSGEGWKVSKRVVGTWLVAGLVVLGSAAPAAAAPRWQAPQTIKSVRGIPDPEVGVSSTGVATVVFADAAPGELSGVYASRRSPGGGFGPPQRIGHGVEPQLAVAPDGTAAIAWRDGGAIQVLLVAPAARSLSDGIRHTLTVPGKYSDEPRIGIAGNGQATIVWRASDDGGRGLPVQIQLATVAREGALTGPETIGGADAPCDYLSLSVNLAGDAVAFCDPRSEAYVRTPGGAFETVPFDHPIFDTRYLMLDGAGLVTAVGTWDDLKSMGVPLYRTRPRGGSFDNPRSLPVGERPASFALIAQERRSVALWNDAGQLVYAVRPAGGEFGAPRRSDVRTAGALLSTPVAPLGPLPLLFAGAAADRGPLVGAQLGLDDAVRALGRPPVPGVRELPIAMASAENGIAVATWEQRCGDGFAVMAMVLDERRGTTEPPCQDRAAPKVLIRPRRARLVGRALNFRAGCDESCRLVVRIRVLRGGRGRPLATRKTPRPRSLAASRYRAFKLPLRAAEAVRVRAALAAGRRVTVRFALSVRDDFENGAVRRVAVPLR